MEIDTEAGKAEVILKEVALTSRESTSTARSRVRRLPSATRLAAPDRQRLSGRRRGPDGTVWVAFVAYQRGGEPDMAAAASGDFRTLRSHAATATRSGW